MSYVFDFVYSGPLSSDYFKALSMIYNQDLETLPLKKLRSLQGERLRQLLPRLYEKVPFYRNQLDRAGIDPTQVRHIEDLPRLPFTYKEDLRDQYPFGLLSCPVEEVRRIHASSGTTGKPTVVAYNSADLQLFDEVVARSLVAAGARPGMKLHNSYGYGLFTGGLGMHGGATQLGMAVIPVSGGMTERQLLILQDFAPEVICCTPSYAQVLSEAISKHEIDPDTLPVKYAILGAEPWTDAVRQEVERGLGVQATNIYGLSEIMGPGVSQEPCDERGNGSHIWEDHFFPEIVHPESGEPLPLGSEGVLVFTTLTKEAMPLLRYWTNDICSLHYDPDSRRSHIKMGNILGRSDEMLIVRGVNLFHTQVEELLYERSDLSASYQLVVYRENYLDEIQLKVEMKEDFEKELEGLSLGSATNRREQHAQSLQEKIISKIGLRMQVELMPAHSIPRSQGGKLQRVVDQR